MDRMVTMKERQPINLKVVRVELDINKLNCIGRRPPTKPVEISLPPLKSCRRKPSIIPSPPSIKHVHFQKKDVKELVEQLLDEIYGNQRDWSTNSFEYSHGSTSAASLASTQSNYGEQTDSIERSYLESLELQDLRAQSAEWQERLRFTGERLARCVRARDRLKRQQKRLCAAFSVVLRHITGDAGARFGAAPEGGEGGYAEWLHAMRLVARLPAGVPLHFRRKLWLTLAERHLSARGVDWPAAERACFRGTAQPDDTELSAQILKDLHRTGCSLFCGTEARENQAMLRRVLLAYARWNKEVGYCQGFNMIAAIILEVMDKSESDSLKVMIYLVEAVLPEGYFADDLRGLSADMAAFRDLLRLRLPRLANHMDHLQRISDGGGVEPPLPDVFTMQWFLTLYATWLPRDSLLRIWDLTLLDGNEILLLTALAIWNMLQDRILSARSADEYYCCMGGGAGAIWEGGETLVAKVVAFGTLPELPKLRSLHRYQVAPPAPPTAPPVFQPPLHSAVQSMTKRGLRLFYSEDEGDSSDDGNKMALATVIPRRENRSGAGDRLSLDIGALKRQYARLRERQRQAHVILAAACARHAAVGVPTSPTSLTVNSLLLGKSAIVSSRGRRLGPPPGAVPPTRRSSSSNVKTESETLSNSADTISWNEEKSRKSMSRRNSVKWKDLKKDKVEEKVRKASIDLDETGDGVIVSELEANEMIASLRSRSSSESSSYSTQSASSTDTSLCDDNAHGTDSDREQDDDKHKNNSKHSKDIKYSQTYDENKIVQDCASKHSPVHFTKNSPDHFTKQSPKHSPEDIVTKYSAEHLTQHSPEHFMKHSSQHFIKHSPEHFMTRSPEHFTKHSPEHFTKHSPEHFTKHSPEHFTKHSPEHFTKHSPEHFTKHSPEHYTKHSPEHYTKHSPEYFVKHSPEHFTKHSPKHYTQHSPADITEHLPTHTTKQSPEHFTKHSLTEHSPIHFTELKPTERQPIKDITDYLDSAAGEPLRTYIDGFETILQDNPIKSTETDKYHATSPFKSLYSPNIKSDNEPLQRLGGINYEINVKSNESIRPTNFPNIKELTDLSPLTLSPCNYRLDHKSPYDYEFESNFKRPSTSKPDIISRPPDIIDSLTMYPNFVPDIDLSEKNISDIESPPRSPGAESIIVSEDEPPIPLKIDKYFEHSPEFFGARFTDPNNADIPNRRATRRSFPRNPKKPDSLTLQSSFNEKLIRDEETERASSLPQSHSFGNTEDLNYERNERDITQSISSLKKQETPEGYSITQQQSPEISKQYSSIINQPSSEISKECSENMSPKNYILQTGRKNSERALQIIQENSKILSRILTKQHNPDTNDISKYESVKSGDNTNEIQQKYYHCIPQRSIEAKLIESPILKESSSDSLLGYRKNNPILESHDKTEFVRIRPISIDDPFSLDIRSTNQGITTKTTKTPSTECLVNKTDLYGWENKGFLVKSEYRPKSEIYEKEAIGFLDNVTHDFPSPENLKIDTKTTPLPDWAHHSYSCEHTASVTLPSTESRDVSTYDKQFTSTDYNQFSSKYNDYVISKASDICSKTVDQGPKVCENLSKTDNSQVSEFAHKVTSSISFTYEPSAEDDSPTGAKSNSSDTLCQITSLDQVSTPISPKIFPNKDISVLSKTYAEKSDRTVLESDDTCSAITPLVETETISSLSYPRSPSTGSYHPFPTRPALRTPKEIGVRLGMYPKDAISSPQK